MALFWGCNFLKQGPAFVFWIEADTLGDYYYYYYYFAHVLSILRLALRHMGTHVPRVPSTDRHNRHNSLLLLSSKSNDSFHPSTSSEKFLLKKGGARF